MKFYIVTPTYNRCQELKKLYQSLQSQTCHEFSWLVVDDGSSDQTQDWIASLSGVSQFDIIYLPKENGGKHTAYNLALDYMAESDYHMVVDSDDWLSDEAVSLILKDINSLSQEEVGLVYPKSPVSQRPSWLPEQVTQVSIPEIKLKYGLAIETAIVIKNASVKAVRFPHYPNETFLSEEIFYIALSEIGKFRAINRELYYFEYLASGLTSNIFTLWKNNPQGTFLLFKEREQFISKNLVGKNKFLEMLKVTLNKEALRIALPNMQVKKNRFKKMLLRPLAYMVYLKRFK
ncbi:glycosyltransferase family 2 protein [Streptococcus himalayensis]|uniref:Glycosyl transferase family A n=1 Tax=Streptococcus himalayensis TaxID=1888195 RepID=A0A917A5P2_9STRE|nr:glycosyltransferase family 2 protein [Streptococcus himalayensis]GGE24872.1 glycosyl transferase family A [Streptococcus himalayensis]